MIVHLYDWTRFGAKLNEARTRCGLIVPKQDVIEMSEWREAHDKLVEMGDKNPDENVCAECRGAVVSDRLTPGHDSG